MSTEDVIAIGLFMAGFAGFFVAGYIVGYHVRDGECNCVLYKEGK